VVTASGGRLEVVTYAPHEREPWTASKIDCSLRLVLFLACIPEAAFARWRLTIVVALNPEPTALIAFPGELSGSRAALLWHDRDSRVRNTLQMICTERSRLLEERAKAVHHYSKASIRLQAAATGNAAEYEDCRIARSEAGIDFRLVQAELQQHELHHGCGVSN